LLITQKVLSLVLLKQAMARHIAMALCANTSNMRRFLIVLIYTLPITFNANSQTPEEIAVQYLVDSIIGSAIHYPEFEKDTSVIYIKPVINEDFYLEGLLTDFKIVSEGLSYGKTRPPYTDDIDWHKEGDYSKEDIHKIERAIKARFTQMSSEVKLDTVTINLPDEIKLIGAKRTNQKITGAKTVFMVVRRALDTGKEYFIEIIFYREFVSEVNFSDRFILDVEVSKGLKVILWDAGSSF